MISDSSELLNRFDTLFDGFFPWLAGQYDAEYGGFWYARSSRAVAGFAPDIESTAQALNILERQYLISSMPGSVKSALVRFFKQRQTEAGYFFDPQNDMRSVDRMVGRAIAYSDSSLRMLGERPVYPLPGAAGAASMPAHLRDIPTFVAWMEARAWKDDAWMACDNIAVTGTYLGQLSEPERAPYMETLWTWLAAKQDPETGFWGGGRPYVRLSGAFKLCLIYRRFGVKLPRADCIFGSLLDALRTDESQDMCWTRNTMDLVTTIAPYVPPIASEVKREIVERTLANLSRYRKDDGGFSRHVEASLAMPNNVQLGQGLAEGDMNASTQAIRVRMLCRRFLGHEDVALARAAGFWDLL